MLALLLALQALFTFKANAAFEMPRNLTADDRKEVVRILGFGTASRILTQPIPLGGREGFEVGLASEFVPIDDLAGLGSKTVSRGEFNLISMSFAKGLPYNIDTVLHFTPLPQLEGATSYGGQVRWGFLEFAKFPALLSLVLHGSGTSFSSEVLTASGKQFVNVLNTRTTGYDVICTVQMDEGSLYFGGGTVRSIGTFTGGASGVTTEGASGDTRNAEVDLTDFRTIFGVGFRLDQFFAAVEVSRITQSTYGGKIGFRF